MYTAGAQHNSSRLSLWRPAPQEKLLLCVNAAAPEKRSRPAHGWKGRPRGQGGRADPAVGNEALAGTRRSFFFSLIPGARWYPTLKPRQFSTLKPRLLHTCTRHTGTRARIFFWDVSIRNSLRSIKSYEKYQATKKTKGFRVGVNDTSRNNTYYELGQPKSG